MSVAFAVTLPPRSHGPNHGGLTGAAPPEMLAIRPVAFRALARLTADVGFVLSTMPVSRPRCSDWVIALRICIAILQAVFLFTWRSRESCRADSPFLGIQNERNCKEPLLKGHMGMVEDVPTVTLKEVLQA